YFGESSAATAVILWMSSGCLDFGPSGSSSRPFAAPCAPHKVAKSQGYATFCGRTIGAPVLCLQRFQSYSRHIIWQESAMMIFKTNHIPLCCHTRRALVCRKCPIFLRKRY